MIKPMRLRHKIKAAPHSRQDHTPYRIRSPSHQDGVGPAKHGQKTRLRRYLLARLRARATGQLISRGIGTLPAPQHRSIRRTIHASIRMRARRTAPLLFS